MLQAIVKEDVYGGLSDELKKEYKKQDDGTYLLDVTPVGDVALENVKGLKSSVSAARAERDKAQQELKAFEGLDVTKAREAIQKVEDMADWKPDDKVKEQIEAIKKQLTDKHLGEIGKKDEVVSSMTKQLEKMMIEANAATAIAESKGSAKLLLPHVKNATRMKQTDKGEFVVEVIDTDGNVRLSPATGSTAPMSIAELVAEMKTQDSFAPAFEGSGASGSGATGSNTRVVNGSHVISAVDAKDPAKYRSAKEAATKAGTTLQISET